MSSFTMFESWGAMFDAMDDALLAKIIRAMYRFAFYGEDTEFETGSVEFLLWESMRPNIESSIKRSEGGKKGGRPRKAKPGEEAASENPEKVAFGNSKSKLKNPEKVAFEDSESQLNSSEKVAIEKPKSDKDKDKDKEKDMDKEGECEGEENTHKDTHSFPHFLAESIRIYNDVTGSCFTDMEFGGDARQGLHQAFLADRTLDDVRDVCEQAKREWGADHPEFITPRSLFFKNFGSLLSRSRSKGKRPSPKTDWPETLPCRACGSESEHQSGAVYYCPSCNTSWMWKESA